MILDVYAGSGFFLSRIPGSKRTRSRIRIRNPGIKLKKSPTLINILPHLFPVRLRSPLLLPPALALLWESSCRIPFPVPDSLGRVTSSSRASGVPAASGTRRRRAGPCGGTWGVRWGCSVARSPCCSTGTGTVSHLPKKYYLKNSSCSTRKHPDSTSLTIKKLCHLRKINISISFFPEKQPKDNQ